MSASPRLRWSAGDKAAAPLLRVRRFEGAFSTTPPQRQKLLASLALQPGGAFDDRAEDDRAIIIGELDEPGFGDEPAKLDQLPRARAPGHHPRSRIVTRAAKLDARAQARHPRQAAQRHRQRHAQPELASERTKRRARASPP